MICNLICNIEGKEVDFSGWSLYVPKDIPLQKATKGNSGNCGVHVCMWEYIIVTVKTVQFEEKEMNKIRSWIRHLFTECKPLKDNTQSTVILTEGEPRTIRPAKINLTQKELPPF